MATITKRGNSYRITVSCGYDLTGRQIRRSTTWTPSPGMSEKQAAKALERESVLFEEKCRNGQYLGGNIRFAEFAERWFEEYAEKELRAKTLSGYRILIKRINAALGHIRMDKLQPHHIIAFYNNLAETGIREDMRYIATNALSLDGKSRAEVAARAGLSGSTVGRIFRGESVAKESAEKLCAALKVPFERAFSPIDAGRTLSGTTIHRHHELLASILHTAVQWQVIPSNPCDRVKPPKRNDSDPRHLDEEGAAKLLDLLEREEPQFRAAVRTLLFTGLRRSELCGLKWADIDFKCGLLFVRRTLHYLPDRGIFEDTTKTKSSARSVKLSPSALETLREHRVWQMRRGEELGDRWEYSGYIFTAWNGAPLLPDCLSAQFREFISRSDLPPVCLHSLRHTNATLQIAGGVPITTVAHRLGHVDATTTAKIYAHAIQSADEAAADYLEDILAPKKREQLG